LPQDEFAPLNGFQKRVLIGVEIEAYSIGASDYQIGRRLSRPRPGLSEEGERFSRDASIGSEYNSRPFTTPREALFLLKSGLRKYLRSLYRSQRPERHHVPLLVGGWTNRSAGTHLHISVADQTLTKEQAESLAIHIHDHLPFLIAIGANSPIWDKQITTHSSNRFLHGSDIHFLPIPRGKLTQEPTHELVYSPGRKRKPATLEIRVMDSNIPEFIVAALCLVKAATIRWLKERPAINDVQHSEYLWARLDAGRRGMRSKLPWGCNWLPARRYLDRFLWEFREEIEEIDPPDEVFEAFRLLKKGYNGARIIRTAALVAKKEHPQTWQRRFAKRYYQGLELLLSGNSLWDFAEELNVPLPNTDNVWLGRKGASIDG
jgi:hypothetical protein